MKDEPAKAGFAQRQRRLPVEAVGPELRYSHYQSVSGSLTMQPTDEELRELTRRGKAMYEELRPIVETPENIGKIISIDPDSGDYAIADDTLAAGNALRSRHPGIPMYAARVGYDAVYGFGAGSPRRTDGVKENPQWVDALVKAGLMKDEQYE